MRPTIEKRFLTVLAAAVLVARSPAAEPKPFVAELKPDILKFEPFTWPGEIPKGCPFERSTNFNAVRFLGKLFARSKRPAAFGQSARQPLRYDLSED